MRRIFNISKLMFSDKSSQTVEKTPTQIGILNLDKFHPASGLARQKKVKWSRPNEKKIVETGNFHYKLLISTIFQRWVNAVENAAGKKRRNILEWFFWRCRCHPSIHQIRLTVPCSYDKHNIFCVYRPLASIVMINLCLCFLIIGFELYIFHFFRILLIIINHYLVRRNRFAVRPYRMHSECIEIEGALLLYRANWFQLNSPE